MRAAKYAAIAGLLAALPAMLISFVALSNNNQGEYADTMTGQYTSDLYILFLVYWLIAGVFVFPVLFGIFKARQPDD